MHSPGRFSLILTDNDIVSKLAHWRLLHHLPELCGCKLDEIVVLPSLKFRAHKAKSKPDKLFKDPDTAAYAYDFLSALPDPGVAPDELVQELQTHPGIDSGEAVLLALAISNDKAALATGDKRALKSLGALQQVGRLLELTGRIICLEQLLGCLIKLLGCEVVRTGISNDPSDNATRMIWGSRLTNDEGSIAEGLSSYIKDILTHSPGILVEES
jgi:hypothetical protein